MRTHQVSRTQKILHPLIVSLTLAAITFGVSGNAQAQTETVLYTFTDAQPYSPYGGGLVFDTAGNLYGAAPAASGTGRGAIFKLERSSGGWQESAIYTFTGGADGAQPYATPTFDAAGNLYGTASYGGDLSASNCMGDGCGVVFKLTPASSGEWQQTVLYTFSGGRDGATPLYNSLVFDAAGNLYGSTYAGGNLSAANCQIAELGCGVIFRLSPTSSGEWKETVLHTFTGEEDGVGPAVLTADGGGNFYGTVSSLGGGNVFKLSRVAGVWQDQILHTFHSPQDGSGPNNVIFDSAGNLYGMTETGGNNHSRFCGGGCGGIFELSPTSSGGWNETVLYAFRGGTDGETPMGGLVFDGTGNLYGTTSMGGSVPSCDGCGTAFKLSPSVSGGWSETLLHTFTGRSDGAQPVCTFIRDAAGNLYGTIPGGPEGGGVVFEITP